MLKKEQLMAEGCSEDFAKRALIYSAMYSGKLGIFISTIEDMLQASRSASAADLEPIDRRAPPAQLDRGNLQVERDYEGSNLISNGYGYSDLDYDPFRRT